MKSRAKLLLDRSVAAMLAGIEIYNKPMFPYRVESFTMLAINAWELLFKAKWLVEKKGKLSSLYVFEKKKLKDGSVSKQETIKRTGESHVPFTHSIEYLAKKLFELHLIPVEVKTNLQFLQEFRNASVHFYLRSLETAQRLQELSMASVKNYTALVQDWFGSALSDFDFFLMPLALLNPPVEYQHDKTVEEQRFLDYLLRNGFGKDAPEGRFAVAINVEVKFQKTKDPGAIAVRLSNDPDSAKIMLTDEQFVARYRFDYRELTDECKKRYSNFVENQEYHSLRKSLSSNQKFAMTRYLDPLKKKGLKKERYSEAILAEFDKHYIRK